MNNKCLIELARPLYRRKLPLERYQKASRSMEGKNRGPARRESLVPTSRRVPAAVNQAVVNQPVVNQPVVDSTKDNDIRSTLHNESLRDIALKREEELSTLKEFTKIETESLHSIIEEEKKDKIALEARLKQLEKENRRLEMESSQSKTGYDLLKKMCLVDLKKAYRDADQLLVDAQKIVNYCG